MTIILMIFAEVGEGLNWIVMICWEDGAPAHGAKATHGESANTAIDFIYKDSWPPNSPDMNPIDYHDCIGGYIGEFQQTEFEASEPIRAESGAAGISSTICLMKQSVNLF